MFYILFAAGVAFILIGSASAVYSNTAVNVALDNTLAAGDTDVITPDMEVGGTANISISGSAFSVTISDPDGEIINSENETLNYDYNLVAQKGGEHRIIVENTGSTELFISGNAQTKGSALALSGQLMLIITGIIVLGLSLRLRR